ncbi:hypothetical protein LO80_06335 [Candidatus Francisella endociliophora]|uniref:Lipoprotein n=1 Tax=Candidatus Francisella endociliophora TaxID=653937 RepID=A0A097EPX3_9GAMM|nr:hypothetical protein [Francisella sp. FSC1006]AIT09617.1 hypothetical protein LO80_06335 [Francisella sp. FSC1006]
MKLNNKYLIAVIAGLILTGCLNYKYTDISKSMGLANADGSITNYITISDLPTNFQPYNSSNPTVITYTVTGSAVTGGCAVIALDETGNYNIATPTGTTYALIDSGAAQTILISCTDVVLGKVYDAKVNLSYRLNGITYNGTTSLSLTGLDTPLG